MYPADASKPDELAKPLWVLWLQNGGIGWVLGLVPLGLLFWFLSMVSAVTSGQVLTFSVPWVPSLGTDLSFMVDGLGLLFAIIVTGVGTMVVVYAGGYMAGDPQIGRFFLYLFLFMFSMIGVVLSNNLILLFIFWELTSITSFLLIGFKHAYESSRYAAVQALLVTGIGGLVMLAGLLLLGLIGGSWEISTLIERGSAIQTSPHYVPVVILILIGAFTKSAQFPFHFWLPGAMAAPAPVSSYLHSATMVKAGVFLMARFTPILGYTPTWQITVATFGAITMFLGGYLAITQTDLKRILAFTTVSGLGTLTMLLGIGTEYAIKAAIVFLIVHALYKAALFMVGGAVDHETGTRDIWVLGGLRSMMPITFVAAVLAGLSMSGIPPFVGFIGKEAIYEATLKAEFGVLALTTVAFLGKLFNMVAAGMVAVKPFVGAKTSTPRKAHEPPVSMWLGPVLLATLGLLLGLFPGFVESFLNQTVASVRGQEAHIHLYLFPDEISTKVILSTLTILAGAVVYAVAYHLVPGMVKLVSQPLKPVVEDAPERAYDWLLNGMQATARAQTRMLQTGYLRYYLLIIVATTVLLGGYGLLRHVQLGIIQFDELANVRLYEAIIVAIIAIATGYIVQAKRRLAAIVGLGVVGYGVALIFLLNSAPDLMMTQFAVETLSVILFVLVIYRLPSFTTISKPIDRIRDAIVAGAAGLLMTIFILLVTATPVDLHLSPYFAENSYTLAQGRNVVNVILVDFRSLDTMGEIVVVAIAAIGIFTLMRLRLGQQQNTNTEEKQQ